MNKKIKLLLLGSIFSSTLSVPLTASAISLNNSWGSTVKVHPNSPMYKITGDDGVAYSVPYVTMANTNNKRYDFYADKGTNAFFRKGYGYAVTYQPVPSGAVRLRGVDHYSWDSFYESTYRPYSFSHNTFEVGYSVKENTVNCGYYGTRISCLKGTNSGNLNPGGVTGHTHQNSSHRADGSFGGTGAWGEARFIGYSALGNHVDNTYYPMDTPKSYTASTYPYDKNVFQVSGKNITKTRYDGDDWTSKKIEAIAELLKQEGMGGKPSDWVNKLSLQTNPITEAPIFLATRDNGAGYQALVVKAPATATMNIGITSMKVYDSNNKLLAGITRDKVGSDKLNISFAGQNLNNRPKLEAGETYRVEIIIQNGSEATTNSTTQKIKFNGKEYSQCGALAANATCTFNIDYKAPEAGDQKVTLEAVLSDAYNSTGDNLDPIDDYMSVDIMVNKPPKGDVALNEIYLVEAKTNKVVQHPIQGVEYYLQFKGTYVGESMRGNELSFKVQADITTSVPQQNGTTAERVKTYYTNTIKTKLPESSSKNPLVFDFKTDTFVATSSTIKANATLIGPSGFKWNYNTNAGNDKLGAEWTAPINLTLTQVTLDPSGHPGGDYCGTLNLSYWVDFKLAYNITNRPLEVQKVEVAFYADGKYLKSDIINVYALQNKRQYTTQLNLGNNCVKPGAQITVKLNPTHKIAESTLSDNNKTITWKTKYPDNYCENNNHYQLDWTQKYLNLATIENGYAVNVDQVKDKDWISLSNYEKVTITKIEMRSKLMADKKMGPNKDGWVDALNPGKDKIQIKAGYGFDIRVTVEYETNAYQNERTRLAHIPMSQLYTPLKPLELTDNLFIKLPGNGENLVSLTTNGLKLQRTEQSVVANGVNKTTWTYTIQERLSPNGTNQMVDSLFIDENTKDGEYSINLYTLPIYGVPGKTLPKDSNDQFIEYDPICAKAQIKFEVKGSVYDDLNIGLIH